MKVPLVLSKFYTNYDLTTEHISTLVEKIGAQLGAVEEVEDFGKKYQGVLVAKVVECSKHENSDHLNVCKIDDGGRAKDVERDANGYVQVVCGAPNVREGLTVAWLPPGATVPESYGKDPFVLEARELRGVLSNGMLASPRELALGDDHDGILEITEDVQPGTPLADAYNLNDHIIDIENKMFTHRPDCFGILGVYREIAGIMGRKFEGPEWYGTQKYDLAIEADTLPLKVTNELPELVPRFMAVAMSDVIVAPSPMWLQVHLLRVGIRPISNIVDVTNFIMYLTGQPLHAYDYDKVKALSSGETAELTVRYPKPDEKISLLNGKTIEPRSEAIMIAGGDHLIGVGGVMGGADTEVSAETRNIILECATFDMYSIRRTSMAHGLFTDAVTRFNKGQSPLQNPYILAKAIHEVRELAGGKLAGEIQDVSQVVGREWVHPPVPVTAQFINERLGLTIPATEMKALLENVACIVVVDGDQLTVTAPFWRTDIETREDVVEEVGRLYGFDKLPLELPKRTLAPVQKDETLELKSAIRARLARAGANEVLTYSFVHGDLLKKVGQDAPEAFQVANALSPDLQYYRLSILPSLLDKVHANIKAGYDEFALFEIGKTHGKSQLDDAGLPKEFERLAFVYGANDKKAKTPGAAYYTARTYLTRLLEGLGVWNTCTLIPLTEADLGEYPFFHQVVRPFDPARSAAIYDGRRILGVVGEFSASTRKALKLPTHSAGFEFGLNLVLQNTSQGIGYQALPRFPKVTQDMTLKVAADVRHQKLFDLIRHELDMARPGHVLATIEPLTIYQREGETDHKQVTFRFTIASYERTLTDAEVHTLLNGIATVATQTLGAELV
ncbi:MAG TPA: phenylalanine--tRNA ligase subunit beta [Candidatus Saccharimonadia bacterium]|nr:phenylalanine--tRNA ligase subunit beta [Candidatus Saccharimonadia bacterium]